MGKLAVFPSISSLASRIDPPSRSNDQVPPAESFECRQFCLFILYRESQRLSCQRTKKEGLIRFNFEPNVG